MTVPPLCPTALIVPLFSYLFAYIVNSPPVPFSPIPDVVLVVFPLLVVLTVLFELSFTLLDTSFFDSSTVLPISVLALSVLSPVSTFSSFIVLEFCVKLDNFSAVNPDSSFESDPFFFIVCSVNMTATLEMAS